MATAATVEHQLGACGVVLDVSDATGDLATGSACNDIGPLTLVPGGEGRIGVTERDAASGDYRFRLIGVPATSTESIAIGGTVTGQLETKGAVDSYTFTAAAGQVVVIEHQVGDCGATIDIADDRGRVAAGAAATTSAPSPWRTAASTASALPATAPSPATTASTSAPGDRLVEDPPCGVASGDGRRVLPLAGVALTGDGTPPSS